MKCHLCYVIGIECNIQRKRELKVICIVLIVVVVGVVQINQLDATISRVYY
jgi:hypothetical protein